MNQNLTIDSDDSDKPLLSKSSQTPGLNPVLATALNNLEVQLDQELTRYRRARNGVKQPKQVSLENYISDLPQEPQELDTITETVEETQRSVSGVETILTENSTLELDNHEEINNISISSSQDFEKIPTPEPEPNTISQESKTQSQRSKNPVGVAFIFIILLASLTVSYLAFNPQALSGLDLNKLFKRIFSTTIKPSNDGLYYIVVDNQGDNTLAQVRQVIPNAYLVDEEKYIYSVGLNNEE